MGDVYQEYLLENWQQTGFTAVLNVLGKPPTWQLLWAIPEKSHRVGTFTCQNLTSTGVQATPERLSSYLSSFGECQNYGNLGSKFQKYIVQQRK